MLRVVLFSILSCPDHVYVRSEVSALKTPTELEIVEALAKIHEEKLFDDHTTQHDNCNRENVTFYHHIDQRDL